MSRVADPFAWLTGGGMAGSPEEADARQANTENMEAARLHQLELANLFADVFVRSPRGPELLDQLRGSTIEVGLLSVSAASVQSEIALTPEQWMCIREGQNSIVRMIEDQIRIAMMPAEVQPQTEGSDDA